MLFSDRSLLAALAFFLVCIGALLIRNGAAVDRAPSLDTPMISGRTRSFFGASLLFCAFVIMLTWVLNPRL